VSASVLDDKDVVAYSARGYVKLAKMEASQLAFG
jgi:hypothetical protein